MNPSSLPAEAGRAKRESTGRQIVAGQVRLLYRNANLAVWITLVAAAILGAVQWGVTAHALILGWFSYMLAVSAGRFILSRRYWRHAPPVAETGKWSAAFAVGAGFAGAGWGAAGILLYPEAHLANQVFLAFIVGGMMLGAASILAPRPEAFFAFLAPTGLAPALRFMIDGDEAHLAMGLMAIVFTVATLITTARIYLMVLSSLSLQFENQDLVEDLQAAKSHADALNENLEVRVRERTLELQTTTELLRAEIAQREQIEEELMRARQLESLGVLAGGIAHDFNNFLTVVQGNLELARMELDADAPVQAILDQTADACQRAALLSSQLLTYAKGGVPVRRLASIAKLITDAVHLACAGAHANIEVSIAEELRFAEVDPGQICQAIHNLLVNARQATPEGGSIEVRAENSPAADPWVTISVRDHGRGIPADLLPRIFDPYLSTKSGGSGLGLATAYAIVVKHGGNLSVETEPGKGAVFTIYLPASLETPAPPATAAAPAHRSGGRLLVMDDEESLRKLLTAILTNLGYEVESAWDGATAIALCERAKAAGRGFDAALLDLTVSGGMGGMEAAPKLKEVNPSMKLIVSSGYSDAPVMSDFRSYGFDAVIPKPWKVADVREVFRKLLAPAAQH